MNEEITLSEWADAYIEQANITTPDGKRRVQVVPELLSEFLVRMATTDDLTAETVQDFLAWRARSVGELTVREDCKKLLTIWRWLGREGIVPEVLYTPKHLVPEKMSRRRRSCLRPKMLPIEPCEETVAAWIDRLLERTK